MSHMNLTTYPIIGLVIFLIVFVAVSARALSRRYAAEYSRAATMPLDDENSPLSPPSAHPAAERSAHSTGVRP
jgi:cbb3-type cytochrome oxidase subunit 3